MNMYILNSPETMWFGPLWHHSYLRIHWWDVNACRIGVLSSWDKWTCQSGVLTCVCVLKREWHSNTIHNAMDHGCGTFHSFIWLHVINPNHFSRICSQISTSNETISFCSSCTVVVTWKERCKKKVKNDEKCRVCLQDISSESAQRWWKHWNLVTWLGQNKCRPSRRHA